MFDKRAFRAEMTRHGYTNATLSKELGITERTLSNRLHTGDFGSKEIEVLIDVLKLKDPMSIFFANQVT